MLMRCSGAGAREEKSARIVIVLLRKCYWVNLPILLHFQIYLYCMIHFYKEICTSSSTLVVKLVQILPRCFLAILDTPQQFIHAESQSLTGSLGLFLPLLTVFLFRVLDHLVKLRQLDLYNGQGEIVR